MQVQFEKTLYINHSSGKTGSWHIEVRNALETRGATIVTQACKVVGGKAVENTKIIARGKNIGKANETSPLEQAIFEAKSKVQQKFDKGYTEEMPTAGEKATNGLGLTKPMLAYEREKAGALTYPAFAQPKLDGNRCLAARIDGKVKLWSRGGKEIVLPHIAEALEEVLVEDGTILDGELYVHGEILQTINSWIKKSRPETARIQYFIYDMVMDECYQERQCRLETLIPSNHSQLVLCETVVVASEEELMERHQAWVAAGYEGSIVRDASAGYETKRSKSLVKVKDFQDAEFTILAVHAGTPRTLKCGTQLQCAVYECSAGNGATFRVTAPGDMHKKHEAYEDAQAAIGKPLTVKFFNKTAEGIPYLPVAIDIRDSL
jgi:DNA ligase-1